MTRTADPIISDPESDHLEGEKKRNFSHFASKVAMWCGSPIAFGLALGIVVLWAVSGPFFGYSETWQIVINTGTTIITFLMVFVIQSSQNRDGLALQLKLNEIIRTLEGARNSLVDAEDMDEKDLQKLRKSFQNLAHRKSADTADDTAVTLTLRARAAKTSRKTNAPRQARKG